MKTRVLLCSVAVIAAGAVGGAARAANGAPPPRSINVIEDIVVTARQRSEAAQSVPIPITAISGAQLDARAAFDMRDLERVTPNLSLENSPFAKNSANIFLRGIGQINWGPAQDPKVGTYLNGVYLGRPQGGVFDLLDIERIEVLRGPQGTLFGRNTTAGLIQVITKEPTGKFEATAKVGAGEQGQRIIAGALDVPITDTLAARVAAQQRKKDGYVHNSYDGSDWNDTNAANGRGTLKWTPSDRFDAVLGADFQRVREHPALATCKWLGPNNGATAGGLENLAWIFGSYDEIHANCNRQHYLHSYEDDPDNRSDIDAWGTSLTLHWQIPNIGQLTSISAYRLTHEINGSWGFIGDSAIGDVLEIQQPSGRPNRYGQRSQELRLNGTAFSDKLDWVVGLYWFSEDTRAIFAVPLLRKTLPPSCAAVPQFCIPLGGGLTLGGIAVSVQNGSSQTTEYAGNNKSKAAYSEGTYHFTDKLALTAGVRYTVDDRQLSIHQTKLDRTQVDPKFRCPDGSVPAQSTCSRTASSQGKATPRVILSYQLADEVLVYGGWSVGYSSGGLNQTPRLEKYQPEVSNNFETGFKSQLFDQRLRLNMTAFYNFYENQQESVGRVINKQNVVSILNAQKAKLYGVETEVTAAPGDGWLITFAHGLVHGKYDKFDIADTLQGPPPLLIETTVQRDVSDTKVIRGSPSTYSVGVSKTFNLSTDFALTTQAGWAFRARRFDNLQSSKVSREDPYGLLDSRISLLWSGGKGIVSVWGTNLLDKKYTVSRGAAATDNFQRLYWGAPRLIAMEVTYNFGRN